MERKAELKRIFFTSLLICLFAGFNSCRNGDVYYEFHDIKKQKWSKYDTLYFYIDSTSVNPLSKYDITIELANNFDYPYRNIWLYAQDNITDTVFRNYSEQHMLADEFGKWYGSGFGALYQLSVPYRSSVQFKDGRNYCLKLIHGMRDEPLPGIGKVGVRIKEVK